MTTLAQLNPGQQFLFAVKVVSTDQVTGMTLELYGPASVLAATATIAPTGVMSGQLAAPPDQIPVNVVTGFSPVSVGDILQNLESGETAVCQWSVINADGSVLWSSAANHRVTYSSAGWVVVGHVTL